MKWWAQSSLWWSVSDEKSPATCPDYFRWINEDLWAWKETGITREMVMRGRRTAAFRLVIVNGSAYVDSYFKAFQSRDTLTVWGILQLLRRYPGKIPDLELMFDCEDEPAIHVEHFRGPNATAPPPLFTFCADDSTFDIPFPDWSFWGWYVCIPIRERVSLILPYLTLINYAHTHTSFITYINSGQNCILGHGRYYQRSSKKAMRGLNGWTGNPTHSGREIISPRQIGWRWRLNVMCQNIKIGGLAYIIRYIRIHIYIS